MKKNFAKLQSDIFFLSHKKFIKVFMWIFICLVSIAIRGDSAVAKYDGLERAIILIETQSASVHEFEVEIALSSFEKRKGLMNRDYLAKNAGMLFIFKPAKVVTMWMKNTLIALDILFIGEGGKIFRIVRNTIPHDLRSISSIKPAIAVLEIAAGVSQKIGIKNGDKILMPKRFL